MADTLDDIIKDVADSYATREYAEKNARDVACDPADVILARLKARIIAWHESDSRWQVGDDFAKVVARSRTVMLGVPSVPFAMLGDDKPEAVVPLSIKLSSASVGGGFSLGTRSAGGRRSRYGVDARSAAQRAKFHTFASVKDAQALCDLAIPMRPVSTQLIIDMSMTPCEACNTAEAVRCDLAFRTQYAIGSALISANKNYTPPLNVHVSNGGNAWCDKLLQLRIMSPESFDGLRSDNEARACPECIDRIGLHLYGEGPQAPVLTDSDRETETVYQWPQPQPQRTPDDAEQLWFGVRTNGVLSARYSRADLITQADVYHRFRSKSENSALCSPSLMLAGVPDDDLAINNGLPECADCKRIYTERCATVFWDSDLCIKSEGVPDGLVHVLYGGRHTPCNRAMAVEGINAVAARLDTDRQPCNRCLDYCGARLYNGTIRIK